MNVGQGESQMLWQVLMIYHKQIGSVELFCSINIICPNQPGYTCEHGLSTLVNPQRGAHGGTSPRRMGCRAAQHPMGALLVPAINMKHAQAEQSLLPVRGHAGFDPYAPACTHAVDDPAVFGRHQAPSLLGVVHGRGRGVVGNND